MVVMVRMVTVLCDYSAARLYIKVVLCVFILHLFIAQGPRPPSTASGRSGRARQDTHVISLTDTSSLSCSL
jgi:hypothetical protein